MYNIDAQFDIISNNFQNLKQSSQTIQEIAQICITALKKGNKIMLCGNGGSAADSQHIATELVCKYKKNRRALNAIALTTDTSLLTASTNDNGFDTVFARQIEAIGKDGDILIGLSTSGNSQNVLNAFRTAKEIGITTIAFTGQKGGKLKEISDILLNVPSDITNNIQEMHIAAGHIICDIIESEMSV